MEDMFATKRVELNEQRDTILHEMEGLQERLAAVELELGAIAAYDDFKRQAGVRPPRTPSAPVGDEREQVMRPARTISRDAVARVIAGAGEGGIGRADIIRALAVKGDKAGEAAIDNRLRDLKMAERVTHEGRKYRTAINIE
ncbi:MAG: hypothetical protein OXG82_00305 [Gammaproteobacteria bacterium]|nr:hypothetical protein [Gammaproteobacteria bacterium]